MASLINEIQRLQPGEDTLSDDGPSTDLFDSVPKELDMAKFERGKQFFIRNVCGCIKGMFLSLIVGLSLDRFLNDLVKTGETSDPVKSFRRYLRTTVHVLKWHYGNIWDKNSEARQSILSVRRIHYKAREYLNKVDEQLKKEHTDDGKDFGYEQKQGPSSNQLHISQYDMALTQAGFIGMIILHPRRCGIRCTESELDDFVYVWRWIGYLLGIQDDYNVCVGGYRQAYTICKAIEMEIILPSLANPPKDYEPMANAFLYGVELATKRRIVYKLKPIVALAFDASGSRIPFELTLRERFSMLLGYLVDYAMMYVPGVTRVMNFAFEKIFCCRKIT